MGSEAARIGAARALAPVWAGAVSEENRRRARSWAEEIRNKCVDWRRGIPGKNRNEGGYGQAASEGRWSADSLVRALEVMWRGQGCPRSAPSRSRLCWALEMEQEEEEEEE